MPIISNHTMTLILTPPRATHAKRQQMSSFQVVSFISEKERSLKEQKFWSFGPTSDDLGGGNRVFMLGSAAFAAPGADCGDVCEEALFLGAVGARSQLDQGVKRDL
jgi:hypothetical protein